MAAQNDYGFAEFVKFAAPFMWKGGWVMKLTTIATFALMFVAKIASTVHPLVLGYIIEVATCDPDTDEDANCQDREFIYVLIIIYAATKFSAELINYTICETLNRLLVVDLKEAPAWPICCTN